MRVLNPHARYNRAELQSACANASQYAHVPLEELNAACDRHRRPRDLFYYLYHSYGRLCPICRSLEFDDRLATRYATKINNRDAANWSWYVRHTGIESKVPLQAYAAALCRDFCALHFVGPPQISRSAVARGFSWSMISDSRSLIEPSVHAPSSMADWGAIPIFIAFYTRDGVRAGLLRFDDTFFFEHWNHPFCMSCSRYVRNHMSADLADQNGWLPFVRLLKSDAIAKRMAVAAGQYKGYLRFDPMRGLQHDAVATASLKIRDGLANARARGVQLGRRRGFCPSRSKAAAVMEARRRGSSYRQIGENLRLSKNTVMRIVREYGAVANLGEAQ